MCGEAGDDFLLDIDSYYGDPVGTLEGGPNATDILIDCERP